MRCGSVLTRLLAPVVAAGALLAWPAGAAAIGIAGLVTFDGAETPPTSVRLSFDGESFEERTLAITSRQTAYAFDLPGAAYDVVYASFSSPVAGDAFWLRRTERADVRTVTSGGLFPPPPTLAANPIVFRRGVRLALPITDRAGRRFRPPGGWRSRGGEADVGSEGETALARGALVVNGIADPSDFDVRVSLAYSDRFGVRRVITGRARGGLGSTEPGSVATSPPVTIDASPPIVRPRRLRGRGYALFVARDAQTGVNAFDAAAYVLRGTRWRALPASAVTRVDEDDPDSRFVPTGRSGLRVQSLLRGRARVRLCVPNGDGVMPSFHRCPSAFVG